MLCATSVLALMINLPSYHEVADSNIAWQLAMTASLPDQAPAGEAIVRINTRDGNLLRPSRPLPTGPLQVAVVEGFGPVPGLSEWIIRQRHLEELSLICIHLSDRDIEAIAGLRQLERLDLRGCVLSDSQLRSLCSASRLRELDLRGIVVSPKLRRELGWRFPHLAIRTGSESW